MKKLFIFAMIAVMFTGCGQNQSSSSDSAKEITDTEVTTTAETSTVTTLTETTTDTTNIDTSTAGTTPAKTTTRVTTAAPVVTPQTTTVPPPIVTTRPFTNPATKAPVPSGGSSAFQQEVVNLVNAERAKVGLSQLSVFTEVQNAALVRASEIISSFSHTRPNGTSCFTALDEHGVKYIASGENIAAGQATPADVMNSWMNSSGHKANILNPDFTYIGVGYAEGGNYRTNWVQMFVKIA